MRTLTLTLRYVVNCMSTENVLTGYRSAFGTFFQNHKTLHMRVFPSHERLSLS